jgi:hypothetical protein
MEARHARAAGLLASWIQRAPVVFAGDIVQKVMQLGFEYGLQPAQHEVAASGCIHEEAKMMRHYEL